MTAANIPERRLRPGEELGEHPLLVVWEITLHCDQPCAHCGSRAGTPRSGELSLDEALEVADALVEWGVREVAFIGGEAYLFAGIERVVERLAENGIHVIMQTGGRAFDDSRAQRFADAGLASLGVSVDGEEATHDLIRNNRGSFAAAMGALEAGRRAGLLLTVNTTISRPASYELESLGERLVAMAVRAWNLALLVPMGRTVERPEWLLEPWRVVEVIDVLAGVQLRFGHAADDGMPVLDVAASNNLGYYGPHESALRSRPLGHENLWQGCAAGMLTLAIEADGTVKGCPSLPTSVYAGGNLRDRSLRDLWASSPPMRFARDRELDELWGRCADCYYAAHCRAGCSWMTSTLLGRRGNNPYCYHRVTQLRKQGLRERLVKVEEAPGAPFDFGRFTIVEEPWDAEGPPEVRRLPVM